MAVLIGIDVGQKVEEDANDRAGASRVGSHDELATALGLAIQCEPIMRDLHRGLGPPRPSRTTEEPGDAGPHASKETA